MTTACAEEDEPLVCPYGHLLAGKMFFAGQSSDESSDRGVVVVVLVSLRDLHWS
jgi:hypothetical protein